MTATSVPTSPVSPTSPSQRRKSNRPSSIDTSQGTLSMSAFTSFTTNGTQHSRRSSKTSQTSYIPSSPITPRPMSSRSSRPPSFHKRRSSRASINSITSIGQHDTNGLGNLADELEQAWDQEEIVENSLVEDLREGEIENTSGKREMQAQYDMNDMHDFGYGMAIQSPALSSPGLLQPFGESGHKYQKTLDKHTKQVAGHRRHESIYDGSDYGPDSDPDESQESLPPILKKRIRDIESVTRMSANTEDTLSEGGGVVKRTIQKLKDLGPQNNIEYGVTRLVTAYTSMTTHRTHKTRDLFSQSHTILYGGVLDLPEEFIDLLLEEIQTLTTTLPFLPQQNPLLSLQILASQTADLTHTLRSLTDLLQESRLAANAATRKLKTVKDMVEDMRIEEELVENSIMLIQAGDWDRRCRQRQAAQTCREVVDGFANRWGLQPIVRDKPSVPSEVVTA